MKKPLLHFQHKFIDKKNEKDNKVSYNFYKVRNHNNEPLGIIEKMRIGKYMHWCFFPDEDTFFTNGCLKEIVEFITGLYSKDKRKNDKDKQQIRKL